MSSADLDLVRSIYADWERGDFSSAAWTRPEMEFVWGDGPSPASRSGFGGMAESIRDWLEVWEDWHVEAEEYPGARQRAPRRGFDTCAGESRAAGSTGERKPWTQSP